MKVFVLACIFFSAAVYSETVYKKLDFCDCGQLGWRVTEYTVAWDGNDTLITMCVVCKTDPQMPEILHQVHVNISNCNSPHIEDCANSTSVHVSNINCRDANITGMDKEACEVVLMITEDQMHGLFLSPFLRDSGVCICGVNSELTVSDDSNESADSSDKSHSDRPSSSEVSGVPQSSDVDSNYADGSQENSSA